MAKQSKRQTAKFRAFVSYSHADATIAKKLHRKMEAYKLPKLLREIQSSGKEDGRLGQLFRDREDLPAALDLSASVKAALAQSQVLIVLCSPNAKNSPWVAKEIELFRELHPNRPILAALVAGEPEDSFPPALTREGEPLAADLRKKGDGWRLGLLKLVAGVAEVPLDSLVQRDAQRQFRSVMVVTLVVGAALLAMTGMTYYAIQQRNDAQHQQDQAEGLVEYMLTDLRSQLKGVGRLDVMTGVNERAMDYYEAQGDLREMPAESLERRARILHAMGEDDEKRGDLDKALAKFTEAHRVTEALLARDRENPDRIFGHAQSEYWVGYIAYLKKDWAETNKYWLGYKSLADRLVEKDPENSKWIREAGFAEGNICTLSVHRTDTESSNPSHCRSALVRMQKMLADDPTDEKNIESVANRNSWMAEFYRNSGNFVNEVQHRKSAIKYAETLVRMVPDNLDYKEIWISTQLALARTEKRNGLMESAIKRAHEIGIELHTLTEKDPANKKWTDQFKKSVDRIINAGDENG